MQLYPKSFLRTAVVAAAILGLSAISWAGPKDCPRVAKDVPFFGAFIGIPQVDADLGTGKELVTFSGVGVANGMDDVLCRSTDEMVNPIPAVDPKTGILSVMTATYKIIGDDGDSIVIWIATPPEKFSQDMSTGHVEFAGVFIVVPGGTGRYRDATGSGTFAGSADVHPVTGIPVNGHLALIGNGRWAMWGTLSGVKEGHCGR